MMTSTKVPLLSDDTLAFGEEDLQQKDQLTHPYVTFFHLFFRATSIIVYLLCGLFIDSFITSFVIIVMLLSMDFWTVKNITGRLMVGLRWWNYVDDDGNSHWIYESKQGNAQNRINDKEAKIFWTALVLTPFIWFILFIIALFGWKAKWLLVVVIALILNNANLYGYVKCKVGQKESITTVTGDFLRKQIFQNAASIVMRQNTVPTTTPTQMQGNVI